MEDVKINDKKTEDDSLFKKRDFENIDLDTDPIQSEIKYEVRKRKTECNLLVCYLFALVIHITFLAIYLYEHGPWSWKRFFISFIITYFSLAFAIIAIQSAMKRHYQNNLVERYFVQWLYTKKNVYAYYKDGLRLKFTDNDRNMDCSLDEIMQYCMNGYYKCIIPWKPNCNLSENEMRLTIKTKQSPYLIFNISPILPSPTPQHMEK